MVPAKRALVEANSGITDGDAAVIDEHLFHYVNERNRDLIPALDEVFGKMKESGALQKHYINQFN